VLHGPCVASARATIDAKSSFAAGCAAFAPSGISTKITPATEQTSGGPGLAAANMNAET